MAAGKKKKELLTIAFPGHVKVLRRGGLQKGNKWFPEAASSFQKKFSSDTDAGAALCEGAFSGLKDVCCWEVGDGLSPSGRHEATSFFWSSSPFSSGLVNDQSSALHGI